MSQPGNGRYLLDTRLCRQVAQSGSAALRQRFARHHSRELALSVITVGELRAAAAAAAAPAAALAGVARLEQLVPVYALPEGAGEHYARLRQHAADLPDNALWLAAHACAEGWTLVTAGPSRFAGLPGLHLEDWEGKDA